MLLFSFPISFQDLVIKDRKIMAQISTNLRFCVLGAFTIEYYKSNTKKFEIMNSTNRVIGNHQ